MFSVGIDIPEERLAEPRLREWNFSKDFIITTQESVDDLPGLKQAEARISFHVLENCTTLRERCLEWMNTNWLWKGFGYRPGYQPLREFEYDKMIELLQPGPLMEERARKAIAASAPIEVRRRIRELQLAAMNAQGIRGRAEEIKSKLLS